MGSVFTVGETLYDIIIKKIETKVGRPGGAMLNTSVSLGRLKIPVTFISEYGNDQLGHKIDDFLLANGINTDYSYRYNNGKTAISIAMLDEDNNADYSFYKLYPTERMRIAIPEIKADDILLFGSSYAISPDVKTKVKTIVENAKEYGALIIYDPNIRSAYKEVEGFNTSFASNISIADIVRCSDEDILNSLGMETADDFYKVIKSRCPVLIYTKSSDRVFLRTPSVVKEYAIPAIVPISTIGAGDNFNAGIIYALKSKDISRADLPLLSAEKWDYIIKMGIELATHVCLSYDNYISRKFASDILITK